MINMTRTIRIALSVGVAVLFAVSCSKEPSDIPSVLRQHLSSTEISDAKTVDQKKEDDFTVTREMIEAFLQSGPEKGSARMSISPYPSKDNPLLYVINYDNGWKIIPGDSRFGLVLAESSTGQIDLSVKTKNATFHQWLEEYAKQIEQARSRQLEGNRFEESARAWSLFRAPEEVMLDAEKIATTKSNESNELMWVKINYRCNRVEDTLGYVAPLLQTKWGQEDPWNKSMPISFYGWRSVTGCPAVAVSQVLFYFHNRQNIPNGLYNSVNITNRNFFYERKEGGDIRWYCSLQLSRSGFTENSSQWDNMPLNNDDATANYKLVSDFMLDVGQRLGLHYSEADTHVHTHDGIYDTTPCNLTGIWEDYVSTTPESVISSLELGSPVIVAANNNHEGHTWVIDGYLRSEISITHTYEWWPVNMLPEIPAVFEYKTTSELLKEHNYMIYQGMLETREEHYSIRLFNMNWGFAGEHDGYASMEPYPYGWQGFSNHVKVQHHLVPGELIIN
ncbi:Peptidase C10 family protein [Bacteroidales bacterium WCE2004]|nr:Peptidase C10 family protein [Bacteroidales bacterium WCE2004]